MHFGTLFPGLRRKSTVDGYDHFNVDYFNSLNDIMPIAFEYGISLIKDGGEWVGLTGTHIGEGGYLAADIYACSDDPLTVIVDCFLQMDISNA